MNIKLARYLTVTVLLLTMSSFAAGGTKELPDGMMKLLGIEKLPSPERRSVLGTWYIDYPRCTISIEQIAAKYYEVNRCSDGSGGKDGTRLTKISATKFSSVSGAERGEYYVIKGNGDLARGDKSGIFDTLPKQTSLWPSNKGAPVKILAIEGSKTKGLSCHDVWYRYGHTATKSMSKKPTNPSWDFAIPERCKDDPVSKKALTEGIRSAQ